MCRGGYMPDVERYYDQNPQHEWDRLTHSRIEYAVTMRAFKEYLPPPPVAVVDIGGGPGRYALAFAREKARKMGITLIDYVHESATALTLPKKHYDVVLLMGPLYHLRTEKEREKAVHEAVSILKMGGFLCASFVTTYAPLRWTAKYDPSWIGTHPQQCEQIISTGTANPCPGEESFIDYTWFAHPAEIIPFMENAGLTSLDLIACEGIVSFIDDQVNELTGDLWDFWVNLNYRLGKDHTVHGAAEHLLYIGRR
jgi:S-adenosylmethionine-dependent methyltransferase